MKHYQLHALRPCYEAHGLDRRGLYSGLYSHDIVRPQINTNIFINDCAEKQDSDVTTAYTDHYRTDTNHGRPLNMVGTICEYFWDNNGRLLLCICFNHGRGQNDISDLLYIWSSLQRGLKLL